MRNLILVEKPGRELGFCGLMYRHPEVRWVLAAVTNGNELQYEADAFGKAAALLGASEWSCLQCPQLPDDLLPIEFVSERLGKLGAFDRVYTHSYMSDRWRECITAVAAGSLYDQVWVASSVRPPDEIVVLTPLEHQRKLEAANALYSVALESREISVDDLGAVESYCRIPGKLVAGYFTAVRCPPVYDPAEPWNAAVTQHERIRGFMPVPIIGTDDPWGLASSEYEKARHQLEISVLSRLEWKSILEIGACTGVFTLRLLNAFPGRHITACEPCDAFLSELMVRVGDRARVLHVGTNVRLPAADVVFASSCLYYARPFPLDLLRVPSRYFVFSHCRRYQKHIVERCLVGMNFNQVSEDVLPSQVESAYGLIDIKDGTIVQVWQSGVNVR